MMSSWSKTPSLFQSPLLHVAVCPVRYLPPRRTWTRYREVKHLARPPHREQLKKRAADQEGDRNIHQHWVQFPRTHDSDFA